MTREPDPAASRPSVKPPFVIFALPRSRTAWLSRFLSYGDWHCGHEELRHARSFEDIASWLAQPDTGTVETAGAPFWRALRSMRPDARIVVVRRPVAEVIESMMRLPVAFDRAKLAPMMTRLDHKLDQIVARADALVVRFVDLEREEICAKVFEHCLPYRHDSAWWTSLTPRNIQCDMRAMVRYFAANWPQVQRLVAQAKQRTLEQLTRRPAAPPEGMTIQQEDFDTWYRDGVPLFREHAVAVGEAPDSYLHKNVELSRRLYDMGAVQITTARCNGRMFGYLAVIVAPSLEATDRLTGTNGTFFASRDAPPGLGLKLQRASLAALRERGVEEVFMRAGVRGSGPKIGALYRRLGAEDFGQMFRLQMERA